MNARRLFSGKIPKLIVPELKPPQSMSECTYALRTNSDSMMREILSVVDSIKELQKDSAILSGVYGLLNDAVIRVSSDGKVADMNKSAENMFHLQYRGKLKSDVSDVLGIPLETLESCADDGRPIECELIRSGQSFHASVSVTRVHHLGSDVDDFEFVVIVRDISDIIKMRDELSASNVKFEALFKALDEASDVIVITDKQNKIIFVNSAFTKHTGYSFDEAVGHDPGFYRSGDLPESFYLSMWQQLTDRQVWQGVLINRSKSGKILYDKTVITPVMNGDPKVPAYYIAVKQIGRYDTELAEVDNRQLQLRINDYEVPSQRASQNYLTGENNGY